MIDSATHPAGGVAVNDPHRSSQTSAASAIKRVLIITPIFRGGGAVRASGELFDELRARGIDAHMLVATRQPTDPPQISALRWPGEKYLRALEWFSGGDLDWRHVGSKWRFSRIDKEDFDVVHMHNLHEAWLSYKSLSALCRRIPSVWTFHDEYPVTRGVSYDLTRVMTSQEILAAYPDRAKYFDPNHPFARRRAQRYDRWFPKPGAIICPSRYLAELTENAPRYAGVGVHRIAYGVSMLSLPQRRTPRDEARRHFGLDLDPACKVVLIIAARLDSVFKGTDLGMKMLQHLAATGVKLQLLIVGNGGEELSANMSAHKIVCTGWISDDALLAKAYRAADATLIPSRADNLPYVGLESLACGTPLLTFRVGGLAEMVGAQDERGVAAEPFDIEQLSSKTRILLCDPQRAAAAGEAGRAWVEAHCSMQRYIDATLDVYEQVRSHRNH